MKRRSAPPSSIPLLAAAGLALALGTRGVSAQDANPSYTLHVYTNLVQVAALVLNDERKLPPPIKREQFNISLDQGPLFHPTQMRVEGDDPISLSILLDVSSEHDDLVKSFAKTFPMLVPQYLHPKDHVSIYALDCVLMRTSNDIPADPEALKAGIASALVSPGLHGVKRGDCRSSVHLWDSVVRLTDALGELPGRRVLVIVSDGKDGKSAASFSDASMHAIASSVAIFGLRDWIEVLRERGLAAQTARGGRLPVSALASGPGGHAKDDEDLFDLLCGGNGGFVQDIAQKEMAKTLQEMVTMLRSRYILEYPRPDAGEPGRHTFNITVAGTPDRVWAPGVSYPSADPALLADPSTVRSAPSPATFGTRRPLDNTKQ
jgi:hypothetical protein